MDQANIGLQNELWTAEDSLGEALFESGKTLDAMASYRSCLATAQRVAANNPENAQWQINIAVSYLNLAARGNDAAHELKAAADAIAKAKARAGSPRSRKAS